MSIVADVQDALKKVSNKKKAESNAWFFKTGKGEYGEGDTFIGVTVPEQRKIAKHFFESVSLSELSKLLKSKVHEHRFTALEILVFKYNQAEDKKEQKQYVDFYLKHLKWVNNWDLVDTSAYLILGEWLSSRKDRKILYRLARSNNLWENRVAIIATYAFIQKDDFDDTLNISALLLGHEHDLIHRAVGWMIREVGNRDIKTEEQFLKKCYKNMPRTMLRYAIEKFPETKRQRYLKGKV